MSKKETNSKIIGNAISAYPMIFVSILFVFSKNNKYLEGSFIKNHAKAAFIIHLGFLFTYITFVSNGLFSSFVFQGIALNTIIAASLFLFLLGVLIFGAYKAKNGLPFHIGEIVNITKKEKIVSLNGDITFDEKGKLTIILSYVPFIGFLNFAKYKNSSTIQNSTKLNLIITSIIMLLYIFGYANLGNFLGLLYIIFVVFIGINLFSTGELFSINITKLYSPEEKHSLFIALKRYLRSYFTSSSLNSISIFIKEVTETQKQEEVKNEKSLAALKDTKLPKTLIYIPFINIIFLFIKKSKYSFHIKNGFIITLLFTLTLLASKFQFIPYHSSILFLIPISYGLGYLKNRLAYKMPFIYDIYHLISLGFLRTRSFNKTYNVEKNIHLKVGETKK
ncbi:hypothetical protein A9Q91_01425 [Candidatus Gracilibacteria bacterium 28_42_T64]|nr:hypothetical protein A9Q91_01425 [Candidatus Gracilibacteria bacterium 28_42_T64]